MSEKEPKFRKLPPHIEAQIPKELQLFREFYFQLSEEDRAKLDNSKSTKTEMPEYIEILKKLNNEVEKEKKQDNSQKTKFCFECGKKINRSAKYCEECGVKQPDL
jgi:predicted transcriptional regulator